MKSKDAWLLVAVGAIRQIIDLFSGTFLITYFSRIAGNPTRTVTVYYLLMYFFLALGSILAGPLVVRKFRLGLFRIGIVFNILFILVFILLGDRSADHVGLIGILSGLSCACYWYPIALMKSMLVPKTEQVSFFSINQIAVTFISIVCPVILGILIAEMGYNNVAVIIGILSVLQLGMTFLFTPVNGGEIRKYQLLDAMKQFLSVPRVCLVFLMAIFMGLTINGSCLNTVTTLALTDAGLSDVQVGYATSVSNILAILAVLLLNRRLIRRKPTEKYVLLCGVVPFISYLLAKLTGSFFCYLLFFALVRSLPTVMSTLYSIDLFNETAEGGSACDRQEEYFTAVECIQAIGRIAGCFMLIGVTYASASWLVEFLLIALLLCQVYFSALVNRYRPPGAT